MKIFYIIMDIADAVPVTFSGKIVNTFHILIILMSHKGSKLSKNPSSRASMNVQEELVQYPWCRHYEG